MRAGGDDPGGLADLAQGACSVDVDVGVEYVQGCPRSHAARLVVQVSPPFRWAGCGRSCQGCTSDWDVWLVHGRWLIQHDASSFAGLVLLSSQQERALLMGSRIGCILHGLPSL